MASFGCPSFLLFLLLLNCVFADDIATTTTVIVSDDEIEEITQDNLAEEMRDQAITVATNPRKEAKILKNVTHNQSTFMPSVHLGPIESSSSDQQRQTTKLSPFNVGPLLFPDEYKSSPFNSLSAIKFGDDKENPPPKPLHPPKLENIKQSPFRPSEKDVNLVKFIDDKEHAKEDCPPASKASTNQRQSEPIYHQHVSYLAEPAQNPQVANGYADNSYDNGHQQQYVNYESKPTKYDTTPVLYSTPYQQQPIVQPQPVHIEPYHNHNEATIMKPEMIINVQHPMSFQAATYDSVQKPKTVIYVSHEPHQYYHQPPPVYNHLESPEHDETYPIYYDQPQYKSLTPWKKILHIIGAFIPLGLLFALLPNVLKTNTNSNNNPSIVLSKLRVNDLTPEHKRDQQQQQQQQFALDTDCREERSICRLLSAADNAGFDFLRNLVIRIAEKTAESSVRKKELDRIFEAAKLGNCDILTCNFYDGT